MKKLIVVALLSCTCTAYTQDRDLMYSNEENTLSLYQYKNDTKFNYVLFYKNLYGVDAMAYEYLNFKSLNDVNLFLFYTLRSMTERKSIHLKVLDQDLYIHGVSKKQAVLSIDDINGCVNKSDITELKTKLAEL